MTLEENAGGFLKIDAAHFLPEGEWIVFQHCYKEGLIVHDYGADPGRRRNSSQECEIQRSSEEIVSQIRSELAGDLDF